MTVLEYDLSRDKRDKRDKNLPTFIHTDPSKIQTIDSSTHLTD